MLVCASSSYLEGALEPAPLAALMEHLGDLPMLQIFLDSFVPSPPVPQQHGVPDVVQFKLGLLTSLGFLRLHLTVSTTVEYLTNPRPERF